jgi:peptidoglycan glycosyltransferase
MSEQDNGLGVGSTDLERETNEIRNRIQWLSATIIIGFAIVILSLVYWSFIQSTKILSRDDNPRLVESELKVRRGRILDTNGVILAETIGGINDLKRSYLSHGLSPLIGYYSFRHGTSGIEASFDGILRGVNGDFWKDYWQFSMLHEDQVGRNVKLSLDANWQLTANTLLGNNTGGVLLLSLPDNAIRALASQPSYDPNDLDELFKELTADEEAPLLNRVTQGQYQPGLLLQPFILASALDDAIFVLEDQVEKAKEPVELDEGVLICKKSLTGPSTWNEVIALNCPAPMKQLVEDNGTTWLIEAYSKFGFLKAPDLPIETEATTELKILEPIMAAMGQENLAVSPLQVGVALATLASEGVMRSLKVVEAVQNMDGSWQQELNSDESVQVISPQSANSILSALPEQNGIKEYSVSVLSGPEGSTNSWYLGLAPAGQPTFAVVVVIEDSNDLAEAEKVGRSLLRNVMGTNETT